MVRILFSLLFLAFCKLHAECDFSDCDSQYEYCCPCDPCELYSGGLCLGMTYATYTGNDFGPFIGWYGNCFLVDIGGNYEHYRHRSTYNGSFSLYELFGHIGLRNRLCCSNVFVSAGAVGSYAKLFNINTVNSVVQTIFSRVGAFIGLEYQPTRHLLLMGKINPYTYITAPGTSVNKYYSIFGQGDLSIAWVF